VGDSLDSLIREFRSEGTVDSAGAFTVSLGQAAEKLRRFEAAGWPDKSAVTEGPLLFNKI
jgi:hypothetical protein